MKRISKPFEFDFTLTQKAVRNLKIVTETVGILHIEGVAYFNPGESVLDMSERYSCDIDFVKWNNVDIRPVLEVSADTLMCDIYEEAIRFAAKHLFTQNKAA